MKTMMPLNNILKPLPENLTKIIGNNLFDIIPFNIAIIDRDFNIIWANKNFEDYFGEWQNSSCFQVCKKLRTPCKRCEAKFVFDTGTVKVSDESGVDKNGKSCHYIVHLAPLKNDTGEVEYVIEMSTDVMNTGQFQREYNLLFERVPSYISIIDKDFRIVRANKKFRDTFGDSRGKRCFEVYKKRKTICTHCPASLTFQDGGTHTATQVGLSLNGDETHYIVSTSPLSTNDGEVDLVIEIATDITEITKLEEQLRVSYDFYDTLIENSTDGIIAINNAGKTQVFNSAARDLMGWDTNRRPKYLQLKELLPEEFNNSPSPDGSIASLSEAIIKTKDGNEIPVRFNALELRSRKQPIGKVAFLEDLRNIKELEKQKLDAERLGAVGQTVAGLAHSIKNLLMGLEGGMYMVDTGLKKSDPARIYEGWDVLQRNFNKISNLVIDFLSFSKGRLPQLEYIDPNLIVRQLIELYSETARRQGVKLTALIEKEIDMAPLDPHGLEACLTNLISNAIDAAIAREGGGGEVIIRTIDDHGVLRYIVEDNGIGMDSEIIQKVFTTFFTTKGGKGTGLGLLTTRKIIQEHGGTIDVASEPKKGSTFTINFPRKRLEYILQESINIKRSKEK